jgi:hypothetical protein
MAGSCRSVTSDHGLFGLALLTVEDAASSSPYGSGPAIQPPELVARNLPVELGCHTADVRLDQVPTRTEHLIPKTSGCEAAVGGCGPRKSSRDASCCVKAGGGLATSPTDLEPLSLGSYLYISSILPMPHHANHLDVMGLYSPRLQSSQAGLAGQFDVERPFRRSIRPPEPACRRLTRTRPPAT